MLLVFVHQTYVLLRKNLKLKRRTFFATLIELAFPIGVIALLVGFFWMIVGISTSVNDDERPDYSILPFLSFSKAISNAEDNSISGDQLLFAPNTSASVLQVMSLLDPQVELRGFSSEADLLDYYLDHQTARDSTTWAAVVFHGLSDSNSTTLTANYTIRMNPNLLPSTKSFLTYAQKDKKAEERGYRDYGFLTLQAAVDQAIAQVLFGIKANFTGFVQRFPISDRVTEPNEKHLVLDGFVKFVIGTWLIVASLYNIYRLLSDVVGEKENRIREGMKMMGLSEGAYWLTWFVTPLIFMSFSASISCVLIKYAQILPDSDYLMLFLFYFLLNCSLITLAFLISTFVNNSKLAGPIGGAVILGFSVVGAVVVAKEDEIPDTGLILLSFVSPVAFGLGQSVIVRQEIDYDGVNTDNSYDHGPISLAAMMWILAVDTVLYAVFAWYADNVLPGEFGNPRKFYFPLQPSYWFGPRCSVLGLRTEERTAIKLESRIQSVYKPAVEAPEEGKNALVQVKGLRKKYSNGTVAVEGLDLTMYEGEIIALLGHNGAGKTTTISMLTGLLPPSGGDATIVGDSITQQMNRVRKNIGVCPQHDILWDELTVREHLSIFAGLKGVSPFKVSKEVNGMIEELSMQEKADSRAGTLSGGQKRRLCLGIALIGGSRVVFLDEVTSGMDPLSRRGVWEVLEKHKAGRVIVWTTHFMDEADILCDRIAILSRGRLRCVGSSLFLKSRFGIGYVMTLVKKSEAECREQAVTRAVKEFVRGAELLSDAGTELAYRLPRGEEGCFADLFREISGPRGTDELGIQSYGVSITSLEEVFLRLAQEGDEHVESDASLGASFIERKKRIVTKLLPKFKNSRQRSLTGNISYLKHEEEEEEFEGDAEFDEANEQDDDSEVLDVKQINETKKSRISWSEHLNAEGHSNLLQQLRGILTKRFYVTIRDYKTLLVQIVLPLLCVVGAVILWTQLKNDAPSHLPPLLLDLEVFGSENVFPWKDVASGQGHLIMQHVPGFTQANQSTYFPQVSENTNMTYFLLHELVGIAAAAIEFNRIETSQPVYHLYNYTLSYNASDLHALPIYLNTLDQAILSDLASQFRPNASFSLVTANFPFPPPITGLIFLNLSTILWMSFIFVAAFAITVAVVPSAVTKERATHVKHLQHTNGLSKSLYWFATLSWDLLLYLFVVVGTVITLASAIWDDYGGFDELSALFTLLLLYGCATFALSYLVSLPFSKPSMAQGAVFVFHATPAFALLISVVSVVANTGADSLPSFIVNCVFFLSPLYTLTFGLITFMDFLGFRSERGLGDDPSMWDFDILGLPMIYLGAHAVLWTTLLFVIEMRSEFLGLLRRLCCRRGGANADNWEEDADVAKERRRMNAGRDVRDGEVASDDDDDDDDEESFSQDAVEILNLRKEYPASRSERTKVKGKKVAVRNLALGIRKGECFAMLGHNGAGKTTTLSILSGQASPTAGTAVINGFDILRSPRGAARSIGVCPQADALLGKLTGREHLVYYARLKGIPERQIANTVDAFIRMTGLSRHADRLIEAYSGGTKRKLSLALALIGNPPVVFLDEPSSGMDPLARRKMWQVISLVRENRAIILTTHSMEEADALSSRIGIMNRGELVCLGSSQHLKSKFGSGYRVDLKLCSVATTEEGEPIIDKPAEMMRFVQELFPNATMTEGHGDTFHFDIPQEGVSLATVFEELQARQDQLGISDYSVSQPTLEQIFLKLTKMHDLETADPQAEEGGVVKKKASCCRRFWCCCCRRK